MKYSFLLLIGLSVTLILSGCCDDDQQSVCSDVGIGMHPADTHVYMLDEVDRNPYFDAGCLQCDLKDRIACAEKAFLESIYKSIKYPAEARENDIQGRVVIRFVIEKDGSVSGFEVVQGIGYGCEEAVIAALEQAVPWIPAIKDGAYVRSYFELPVSFKLQ